MSGHEEFLLGSNGSISGGQEIVGSHYLNLSVHFT